MSRFLSSLHKPVIITGALFCVYEAAALEFEPGAGVGVEYTDNARRSAIDPVDDLIVVGYLGAFLLEDTGPLQADVTAALNHHRYTKDTYKDQRYFNLRAGVRWEMIQNRFNWLLNNFYQQRPINTTDPNTPDNIQDSNIFTFGANMFFPISARQSFVLFPQYKNFYYEIQNTDNQQASLVGNWDYQVNKVTNVGLNASVRTVDYNEPLIDDVTFSELNFVFAGRRARSAFNTNLGTVYVSRSNGQSTEEFSGNLNWVVNLTGRSTLRTFVSTGLTEGGQATLRGTVDPGEGNPDDIQITTDIIRNQIMTLGYQRTDLTLTSNVAFEFRNLNYSESPNDRRIRALNADFNYPVTALLVSSFNIGYNTTELVDQNRTDNNFAAGGDLRYQISRSFNSVFSLYYRNRDSTDPALEYSKWSVFVSLAYGFGQPQRPGRTGGF